MENIEFESPLAKKTILALRKNGYFASFAESCTGGLISKMLTDVPGSSDVIAGGVVSYSNHVKEKVLGVSHETLEKHGAVSEETALEMCTGVRELTGADISVSVTGIAGPTGGSTEKPVGTVCFGIAHPKGAFALTEHFGAEHSRDAIRHMTAERAMALMIETLQRF